MQITIFFYPYVCVGYSISRFEQARFIHPKKTRFKGLLYFNTSSLSKLNF